MAGMVVSSLSRAACARLLRFACGAGCGIVAGMPASSLSRAACARLLCFACRSGGGPVAGMHAACRASAFVLFLPLIELGFRGLPTLLGDACVWSL
eukprot:2651508-Amphidinium_carterae.1